MSEIKSQNALQTSAGSLSDTCSGGETQTASGKGTHGQELCSFANTHVSDPS